MEDSDAILAYQATNAVEAHALVAYLANAGIDARVLGESLQGAYAGIRLGDMDLPEVWVAGKDRDAAEPLIASWTDEHNPGAKLPEPRKFQFSLLAAMLLMTIVALLASARVMGAETFGATMAVVLTFLMVLWVDVVRRRQRRAKSLSSRVEN